MKKSEVIIDKIQGGVFAALTGLCVYGAVFEGAWWHWVTAAISAAMSVALFSSAKNQK